LSGDEVRQRLAAIVAADAAGYTRLMGADEASTMSMLEARRAAFRARTAAENGRIVDTAGDSVLAVFESAAGAVRAALSIQKDIAAANTELPEDRRMAFRIGVHLGDVMEKADGTIYGDGVNIAARLESLAEPGGIVISDVVHSAVRGRINVDFVDLGEQNVKNVSEPIRPYRAIDLDGSQGATETVASTPSDNGSRRAAGTRPVIAVLPFDNMSGNPDEDYFSDGLTEDIITELARFTDIDVLSRNSTFQYKGTPVKAQTLSKELGASYMLEGSVRRGGNRVRVTAQLIDADRGDHVWAERYDRDLEDIFAVQDELTQQIAAAMGHTVQNAALERTVHRAASDLNAYDCVLRARRFAAELTPSVHARARDLLETAIALDPTYSRAHAMLADVYLAGYRFDFNPQPQPLERAFEEAMRAVELDPRNAYAHFWLAAVYYFRRQMERFDAEADRAQQLNPNDSELLADLGHYHVVRGNIERGIDLTRQAMRLNPLHPGWYYFTFAFAYCGLGDFEQALVEIAKIDMDDFFWTPMLRAAVLGQLGRIEEARAALAAAKAAKPGLVPEQFVERWMFHPAMAANVLEGLAKAAP
jgi:TolB-like protein